MSVTVWDVFRDPVLRQCDPLIAAGSRGMDHVVRWAYSHERYDVTQFLSGGELLIIEGSALADLDDDARRAYIDALAEAGVSGLAIELVDFFRSTPDAMVRRADERALPIIGLRRRMPFVALCQEINTRIVREQMLSGMEIDTMSTSLRRGMTKATSAGDVADVLFRVLGESVVIFDAGAGVAARAGLDGVPAEAWKAEAFTPIPVRGEGTIVATVAIGQRFGIMDAPMRGAIAAVLDACLAPFMVQTIEGKIRARLLSGAADGLHAGSTEVAEGGEMMRALGFLRSAHVFAFALVFNALDGSVPQAAERLRGVMDRSGESGRSGVIVLLEGNVLYGCFLSDDAFTRSAAFNEECRTALTTFLSMNVWVVAGVSVTGASGLLDHFAALRYEVAHGEPNWGHMTPLHDGAIDRMLSIPSTSDAVDAFVGQIAGGLLPGDADLVDTLCALAESAGGKTQACARLGITRQTLYNRLDKVTEITGIEQQDRKGWDSLLIAARMIVARRGRG
ncbi:Purine catabolism regulatory protein-like family [Bifidobacterium sp. DSM 109958]|uniref:Purine catabolism regulatory protein-like family n=2 Tax=Bifidobacterium moraviense TaxID=2675323 RepID=A0A7Y0F192_9BIFI|nr:Purine catabolism regulatory protein-like family [Bifidobacterium sp. DSM 109958]